MQINGETIEWKLLKYLYHKFHSIAVQSAGLSLVPKLKMEKIELTSFSQKRVDLAAQVSNCTNPYVYVCWSASIRIDKKLCDTAKFIHAHSDTMFYCIIGIEQISGRWIHIFWWCFNDRNKHLFGILSIWLSTYEASLNGREGKRWSKALHKSKWQINCKHTFIPLIPKLINFSG